jgi:serine protease inhibitor ecotin
MRGYVIQFNQSIEIAAYLEITDQLVDLSKYSPRPSDGGVVGWVMHTEPQNHKTKLDIKVQALKTKEVKSGQEQGQAKSASREEL